MIIVSRSEEQPKRPSAERTMRKIGVRDVMSVCTFVDVLDNATVDASIDQHATCMAGPARTLPSEDP